MTSTQPGWYPDPHAHGQLRYWDGQRFTDTQPGVDPTKTIPMYAAERPLSPAPSPTTTEWYQRKPVVIGVAAVALVAIGAALGGGSGSSADQDDAPPAAAAEGSTVDLADQPVEPIEPVEPVEEPAAVETPTAADEAAEPAPAKASKKPRVQVGSAPAASGDTFVLPDETGKVLQAAQDDVQAVSGNPFYFTSSEDATGEGRFQVLDSGWQVCSQSPAAGTQVDADSDIIFYVVRVEESCP